MSALVRRRKQKRKRNSEGKSAGTLVLPVYVTTLLLIAALLSSLGCYGTQTVKIKVPVESKIDMRDYRIIAVMDFIDVRERSSTEEGQILARMIRKQLKKSKDFRVMDERSMNRILEEDIDKSKLEDSEALVSICEQLEVDALIIGMFDLYQLNQPVPYIVERYSPETGRYRPETRTYIQRVHRLLFQAKVVDGRTGDVIFDYAPVAEERPEYRSGWGLPFSTRRSDPANMRSMATRVVSRFVMSLVPHYENERRILVR